MTRKNKTPKPVRAWGLENPRVPGELFGGSRPVRLFYYKYEAQSAAEWQRVNGMMPWIPVRVLITIDKPRRRK